MLHVKVFFVILFGLTLFLCSDENFKVKGSETIPLSKTVFQLIKGNELLEFSA